MRQFISYLTFDGNARQAMEFYAKCFQADLRVMTFEESKMECPPEAKDKLMHAKLVKGAAVLMASDTMPGRPVHKGNNFSVSVDCESIEEAERLFNSLKDKGEVTMPLQETFWAKRFGMLKDQFGIQWMLNVEEPHEGH